MARTLNRLTANQIKAAKGKQMLPDGGGLYLQVTSDAAKSWLFRYRWKGKRPEIGLGPYPAVTLAEARRRQMWQGPPLQRCRRGIRRSL